MALSTFENSEGAFHLRGSSVGELLSNLRNFNSAANTGLTLLILDPAFGAEAGLDFLLSMAETISIIWTNLMQIFCFDCLWDRSRRVIGHLFGGGAEGHVTQCLIITDKDPDHLLHPLLICCLLISRTSAALLPVSSTLPLGVCVHACVSVCVRVRVRERERDIFAVILDTDQ